MLRRRERETNWEMGKAQSGHTLPWAKASVRLGGLPCESPVDREVREEGKTRREVRKESKSGEGGETGGSKKKMASKKR